MEKHQSLELSYRDGAYTRFGVNYRNLLLFVGGDASVEADAARSLAPASPLAKNPVRISLISPFSGHFRVAPSYGRNRCFPKTGVYAPGTMFPNRGKCIPRYPLSLLWQRSIVKHQQHHRTATSVFYFGPWSGVSLSMTNMFGVACLLNSPLIALAVATNQSGDPVG